MGIQINRIEKEFIFKNLENAKIDLSVHGNRQEVNYRLASFQDDSLNLKKNEPVNTLFPKDAVLHVFFPFQSNYYTFETKVTASVGELLTVENPRSIYRDPQRKYERIPLKGFKVYFLLEGEKVELDFPKTETFALIDKPELSNDFKPESIVELINTFRNHVHGKVSDHKIVMYREKNPQSFEERLMIKTAKTLWIPSTDEDLPLHDPNFTGNIIVKKEAEDFLGETGTPKYLIRSELSNLLYTKAKSNIFSEIYCPILYHEYAVGYIYVVNKRPRMERLEGDFLNYVLQFSHVLSYSLEINGYYRQHSKTEIQHNALVIDLSGAGLLFTSEQEEVNKRITVMQDLDLNLEIQGRRIVAGSRIMRAFNDSKNYYFAAQFMKIGNEDFNFLFEFLYGKPFSEEAAARWEGGAPPPAL